METRKLGRTDLQIPVIGLGAMFIGAPASDAPSEMDEDLAIQTVVAAIESGSTFIDTAPVYGGLASERAIGRVLRERPELAEKATVVTKVGARPGEKDYSYDAVMRHVEGSQERLGMKTFDLLSIHDAMGHAIEEVLAKDGALGALRKLQDEGTVRYIGSAMNDPYTNEPYIETGEFDVAVVPNAWSLINRVAENRIFPAAEKHGVGLLMAQPFERGLLAKGAKSGAYFHRRNFSEECLAHVSEIESLCERYGHPLAAVSLHYILRHPLVGAVIPGARTPEEATQNAKASEIEISEAFWDELTPMLRHWEAGEHR
jgi:D-threo-aldose 1-dehydrogenase